MPYTEPKNPLTDKIYFFKKDDPDGGYWRETSLLQLATACFGEPLKVPSIQDVLQAHQNGVCDVWNLYLQSVIDGYIAFEMTHEEIVEFLSGDLRLLSFYCKIYKNTPPWQQFSVGELLSLSTGIRESSILFQEIQSEIERQKTNTAA